MKDPAVPPRLTNPRSLPARLGWIAACLTGAGLILYSLFFLLRELPGEYQDLLYSVTSVRLRGFLGLPRQAWAAIIVIQQVLVFLVSFSTGLLIFFRRVLRGGQWEWVALLVAVDVTLLAIQLIGEPEHVFTPLDEMLVYAYGYLTGLSVLLLINLLFIFPDGRYVPRWTVWVALGFNAFWIVIGLVSLLTLQLEGDWVWGVLFLLVIAVLAMGLWAQVNRYRKYSSAEQRQQTRWVVLSLAMLPFIFLLGIYLGSEYYLDAPQWVNFTNLVIQFLLAILFPLAIGVSVLRYRLWDIGLIIRKTLVYSLLSGLLGLVYFGGVGLLQSILTADRGPLAAGEATGGQPSTFVIVVTTLALTALFGLLVKPVQDFIDRRFYRRKYDAEKALAEFAAAARSQTDLAQLSAHLISTVKETLQPEQVSLWLKPTSIKAPDKKGS